MADKYFAFISAAYGITFVVLAGLAIVIRATYRARTRQLARLEEQGLARSTEKQAK